MIVIADTSPLHYLILLERAEVLQHLYGRVIIPEAVVRELQAQKTPAVVRRWITSPPEWLQIRQIAVPPDPALAEDRKSTRLNSSHVAISYAVFCLKKKNKIRNMANSRTTITER